MESNIEAIDNIFSHLEDNTSKSESVTDKNTQVSSEESKIENKEETTKTQDKNTSNTSDEVDKSKNDENVPFHKHPRFQEIIKERKELRKSDKEKEKKIFDMGKRIKQLESQPLNDEQLDGKTPAEIKEMLEKQIKSEMEYNQLIEKKEKEEADKYVTETIQDLKDSWFEFDENELLNISVKYTNGDIEKAFELYQKFNDTKQETIKEEEEKNTRLKQSESNTSDKTSKVATWFTRWTSWEDLRANLN